MWSDSERDVSSFKYGSDRAYSHRSTWGNLNHSWPQKAQQVDEENKVLGGAPGVYSVIPVLGNFLISVDLVDTYFHISVRLWYCRFLRFAYSWKHYQYWILPFGLSSAPKVYTKKLVAISQTRITGYLLVSFPGILDDILIRAPSPSSAHRAMSLTLNVLQVEGFVTNVKKSLLTPSAKNTSLRSGHRYLDSKDLPISRKVPEIQDLLSLFQSHQRTTIALGLPLIGLLVLCIGITLWVLSHIWCLQGFILNVWDHSPEHMKAQAKVLMQVLIFLKWWSAQDNVHKDMPVCLLDHLVLTTRCQSWRAGEHMWGCKQFKAFRARRKGLTA